MEGLMRAGIEYTAVESPSTAFLFLNYSNEKE